MDHSPEKMARMDAATETMHEKIDVYVHENNSVTLCMKGINETFSRNEFGALVDRLMQLDFQIGDAE